MRAPRSASLRSLGMPRSKSRACSKCRRQPAMSNLDWLTARPIAHRGLHDARAGRVENTPSAFAAAIAAGYGIECDLQLSVDGEAMVHHDERLGRLTDGDARLDTMTAADLKQVAFRGSADRMLTVG